MYKEEEKVCLKWNDFRENAISAFGNLREDREFADVTLFCEDGQQVDAHKVILASSSPFFQNLLRRNKHPHPLIYMRGMTSKNLLAMIDFLYFGEANVFEESLDSFIAVAEELQLKGLGSRAEKVVDETKTQSKQKPQKEKHAKINSSEMITSVEKVEETIALFDYTETVDAQGLEEKIGSMMEPTEKRITVGKGKRMIWVCKVCGKEGQVGNVQHHIESHHITGVTHTCNICGKTSKSRNALGMHKSTYHKKSSKPKEIHLELFTCQTDLQGAVE